MHLSEILNLKFINILIKLWVYTFRTIKPYLQTEGHASLTKRRACFDSDYSCATIYKWHTIVDHIRFTANVFGF